jgi:hypothetical protein
MDSAHNCINISSSQAFRSQFHRSIHFMYPVSKCLPSTQVLVTASLQRRGGVAPEMRGRGEVSKIHTFRVHCPTVLGLKIPLFWDMTPCSLINIYRRVGEIFHPLFKVRGTRLHIAENSNLQTNRRVNPEPHIAGLLRALGSQ